MTEPMSTPDSGGLREAVTALAKSWATEAEAGRTGNGHALLVQTYDGHARDLRAILAAHPESVPTPDSGDKPPTPFDPDDPDEAEFLGIPFAPDSADDATVGERECRCAPCPGRGNDGHAMTHCAECCWGTGVKAEYGCPIHYPATPPANDANRAPVTGG